MNAKRVLVLGLLSSLALAACATDQAIVDEVSALSDEVGAVSQQMSGLQQQVDDLSADLEAVQAELEASAAEHEDAAGESGEEAGSHEASAFAVAVAQYVMDTAGFHAMDVALNEGDSIDPSFASAVTRVHRVLSSTTWPEELESSAASFLKHLETFSEALADDDLETAAPLATEAHELQHDLSHGIDAWLGSGDDHGHEG